MINLQVTRVVCLVLAFTGSLVPASGALAQEIKVVSSGGFVVAFRALAPEFERLTGYKIDAALGPSVGNTFDAVPSRLARGEAIDVVIMVGNALTELIDHGQAIGDSRADIALSGIGVAVRAVASKPDISTAKALKRTLLAAKSIAYSDAVSGVYIRNELFSRLGIADEVAGKARMISGEPIGAVVARGEAEIGFQQISELKPIAGIDLVGPLPPEVQKTTVYSAAMVVGSRQAEGGRRLIEDLASPEAATAIRDSGMEPADSTAE